MRIVTGNLSVILLAAFLCAIGGVMLWISGGSTWYILRGANDPWITLSLSGVFIVWLLTYGLVGVLLALVWLAGRSRICTVSVSLRAFALIIASYLLMLLWYAIFFCTRLVIFSVILLLLSIIILAFVLLLTRRFLRIISALTVIIELVQIYFIWFSFAVFR